MRFWCPHTIQKTNRVLDIGWLIDVPKAGFIWEEPTIYEGPKMDTVSSKALQKCPALLNYEGQTIVVPCPFDLHLRIGVKNGTNQVVLQNMLGEQSPISNNALQECVIVVQQDRWRHPQRPVIQIKTPYRFITDETCYLSQLPPFLHYFSHPWPGVLVTGRFPTHIWPRLLMWAFEWHDTKQDLILKRGEPWFFVRFESQDPTRMFRLVEAERTPDVIEYCSGLDAVTGYVKQTFSLFKTAEKRRPKKLLTIKQR